MSLKRIVVIVLSLALAGGAVFATLHSLNSRAAEATYKTPEESDPYVRFGMEAYDKIRENYWASTTEEQVADHFQLSLQKALNSPVVPLLATRNRVGTAEMLKTAIDAATSTAAKKQMVVDTLIIALYNLQPVGHGQLLSAVQETELRQGVSNIHPEKNLYQDLGLAAGASAEDVNKAAEEKQKVLAAEAKTSSEARKELEQVSYAKEVLANPNTKDLYDAGGIEPTVKSKAVGKTLYVSISSISPTTFIEFGRTILSATTTPGLSSMIIDLRGNLGGSLDFAAAFVGLFIGENQYAYDLYHQGEYKPQRTTAPKFAELGRYKEIAILTDGASQSTAEVTTAAMKRLGLAHSVGETTRGWGTVENTFPIETVIDPSERYSMLLVHSLTLRDDNQPVESNGVVPDVSIKDPNWKSELSTYFRSTDLIAAVKSVF